MCFSHWMRCWVLVCGLSASTLARGESTMSVVVGTTMLECAVRDAGFGPKRATVSRLIPPGSCPGHFDVSPSVLPLLNHAAIVIFHDFQKPLAKRVQALTGKEVTLVGVANGDSLLIPSVYARLVDRVGRALAQARPNDAKHIAAAVEVAEHRLDLLANNTSARAKAWRGTPVIASAQQRAFCEWLGLQVVDVLTRAEDMSPKDVLRLSRTKARLVLGNLQSDDAAAKVLATRMSVPVAILSNFPDSGVGMISYEALMARNLNALDRAWHSPP